MQGEEEGRTRAEELFDLDKISVTTRISCLDLAEESFWWEGYIFQSSLAECRATRLGIDPEGPELRCNLKTV